MARIHTEWLKARKKELGINDEVIGKAIGRDRSIANKLISGALPFDTKYLSALASVFQLTETDVLYRFGVLDTSPLQLPWEAQPEDAEAVIRVPLLGEVPAGPVREAIQQSTGSVLAAKSDAPKDSYALRVSGESMNEKAPNGCTIIVNPNDTAFFPGRRYVIRNADGEATFKEYQDNPARLVAVSTFDHYEDIILGGQPIDVLGRVTSVTKRL